MNVSCYWPVNTFTCVIVHQNVAGIKRLHGRQFYWQCSVSLNSCFLQHYSIELELRFHCVHGLDIVCDLLELNLPGSVLELSDACTALALTSWLVLSQWTCFVPMDWFWPPLIPPYVFPIYAWLLHCLLKLRLDSTRPQYCWVRL